MPDLKHRPFKWNEFRFRERDEPSRSYTFRECENPVICHFWPMDFAGGGRLSGSGGDKSLQLIRATHSSCFSECLSS